MESTKEANNCRQPYKKPELRVVELESDQVLATGCKSQGVAGALVYPCAGGCFGDGS